VKRDFSNGFLVAEIFSRYAPADVEMHSYDNGHSLQRKLDNWAQLNKFFKKKGFVIDRELINDVVHCKSLEAPTQLIASVYTQLTGREVKLHAAASDAAADPSDPAYARPNASSLLTSQIRDSELATTLSDQSAAAARAKSLIDEHADNLRSDRELQPSRYGMPGGATQSATASLTAGMMRGPPKPVPQEIESAQVRFQEVRVTQVDRNIAQLRASRDQALAGGTSYASNAAGGGAVSGAVDAASSGAGPPPPPPRVDGRVGMSELLSSRVLAKCPDVLSLIGLQAAGEPSAFAEVMAMVPQLPVNEVVAMFDVATAEAAQPIAAACKAAPSNAWELFSLLTPAITTAEAPEVYNAVCGFLCAVGALLSTSKTSAYSVLTEFALPFFLPTLHGGSNHKIVAMLRVVYALVPATPEAHIDAIRALQNGVNDQAVFVGLLPNLISMETTFSSDLVALYIYYCVLALDLPSPKLRAASIGMLVTIAEHNPAPILALIPKLDALAEEGWWEMQAQLGRLCGALLAPSKAMHFDDANDPAAIVGLLSKALSNRCPAAQAVVLSSASPVLSAHPALLSPFVESLVAVELPSAMRAVLCGDAPIRLPMAGGTMLSADPLPSSWPALMVATALMDTARARSLDTLEPAYTEVLSALLAPSSLSSGAGLDWSAWLKANKDYLYVALCDEELCVQVTTALKPLFAFLKEEALPTFSTLLSSLRMVCDNASSPVCASVATDFLLAVLALGPPFISALRNLVSNFDPPMRAAFVQVCEAVEAESQE
jgi:hypothetical protein